MTKPRKPNEDSADLVSEGTRPSRTEETIPYVVGVGASAGGLEAFEQFFSHLPSDTGLAFVLVPHLEPTHKGMMPELLARHTKMPVAQVEDGMKIRENCVYVIPPNADLSILHGKLQLLEPIVPRGQRMPIDFFFRHLASDQKEKAIGIILSGMGSDGTLGMKAIKENFGMVMAQDPASANYDSMPRSAINTGMVDYVAAAQELPAKLMQYAAHVPAAPQEHVPTDVEPAAALEKVFVLLRSSLGCDQRRRRHPLCQRADGEIPGTLVGQGQQQCLCDGPRGAARQACHGNPQRRDTKNEHHRQRAQGQVQRRLDDCQPHGQAAGRAGRPARHAPGGLREDDGTSGGDGR
jgi:two-component system CheB/CheR fusion protein